jgi:hypothetical protein
MATQTTSFPECWDKYVCRPLYPKSLKSHRVERGRSATWRLVELCLSEHGCDIEVSGCTQLLQTHWKLLTPRLYSANASGNVSM